MGELIVFLNVISLIVTIMIVWFNSGAFSAYCKILGLNKLLLGYDSSSDSLTFPQYLYVKRNILFKCPACLFIIELITCPLCLCMWLSIISACLFLNYFYIPPVYLVSLGCYFFFNRLLN